MLCYLQREIGGCSEASRDTVHDDDERLHVGCVEDRGAGCREPRDVLIPLHWTCAGCGETNESAADPSQGRRQAYVEDCQVCCRPNLLSVTVDQGLARAEASLEDR